VHALDLYGIARYSVVLPTWACGYVSIIVQDIMIVLHIYTSNDRR